MSSDDAERRKQVGRWVRRLQRENSDVDSGDVPPGDPQPGEQPMETAYRLLRTFGFIKGRK